MTTESQRADWMRDAKWGVMLHFLSGVAGETSADGVTVDTWNRRVDEFDADGLADQLESVGAGYLCLTVGQTSGYYCSPSAAYDRIVGHQPSRCSERDLMADVAHAVTRRGIREMEPGDGVFFQSLTWHASDPNRSTSRRIGMTAVYNSPADHRHGQNIIAWANNRLEGFGGPNPFPIRNWVKKPLHVATSQSTQ